MVVAGAFALLAAFVATGAKAQQVRPWSVNFIPNEADSVTVNINNQGWVVWRRSEGPRNYLIPDAYQGLRRIHVYAAASPRGKNASLQVLWNGVNRQTMDFDNDEDHDVDAP
jgi:hypothetical protein